MRGVFERPPGSGTWWINYYDAQGKRHRERVGRYNVAIEAYLQRRQEVREGKFTPPRSQTLTFRKLVDLALAEQKTRLASRSYHSNRWISEKLVAKIGDLDIASITPAVVGETLQKLREQGLAGGTVNRYRNTLSGFFHFAVSSGRIPKNPCSEVKKYKEADPRIRFWPEGSDEEKAVRVLVQLRYPEREAELDLALHTGMRLGEQFHLTRDAVNLDRGLLTVDGKTGRRHIPINAIARRALEQLLTASSGPYVIPGCKRADQRDWREWFKLCVRDAGVKNFHWHDLRHTFASRLVMAGADLASVMRLLGHKNIQMTMRYAHLAPDHLKGAIEKIAQPKLQVVAGTQMAPRSKHAS